MVGGEEPNPTPEQSPEGQPPQEENPNLTLVPERVTEDPAPPLEGAEDAEWADYMIKLAEYANIWCSAYRHIEKPRPQIVWGDFTTDFSPVGIQNLEVNEILRVREVLLKNGVHVSSVRGYSRKKALIACWEAENCPLSDDGSDQPGAPVASASRENHVDVAVPAAEVAVQTAEVASNRERSESRHKNVSLVRSSATSGDRVPYSPGLSGLMKAYGGREKYSGGWDEDLLGNIEVYEMSCRMCDLDSDQMLKGIVVMLSGPALAYYDSNLKEAKTYDEVIDGLIATYTSEEQRSRILRDWQTASLTAWMRKSPEKSEAAAFRDLFAYLSKIQRQLHPDYRKDRFLKDQLVSATDIPVEESGAILPYPFIYLGYSRIYTTITSMFCRRTCEADGEALRNYFVSVQDSNNYFLTSYPPGKLFGTPIIPFFAK